jgi:micrococcal nuclease|tara:strand:+ start:1109 stop:1483 length:375 start_codon:yes stop_codon:yes gene_type:complete
MKSMQPFIYNCTLVRIIDGDTLVADLDLGFGVWLRDQRVRLHNINTPESRTRNTEEKKLGLLAKARLSALVRTKFLMKTEKDERGKFGRILGTPLTQDGVSVCQKLVEEGHARWYDGGKREPWV